jgi:hypothetical protein
MKLIKVSRSLIRPFSRLCSSTYFSSSFLTFFWSYLFSLALSFSRETMVSLSMSSAAAI